MIVSENENLEYGDNITVNYISALPKQRFEVIVDRERERCLKLMLVQIY